MSSTVLPHTRTQSLFQITWPLLIDLGLHFLTAAINTFMVSHVSDQAVAALSVGNQVFEVSMTLFNFVAIGSSVVVTQYLGARQHDVARGVIYQALGFNALIGLAVAAMVLLGDVTILRWMNTPASLVTMSLSYLQIMGLCLIPEAVSFCLAASLRAYGFTKEAMYVTTTVNILTVIGNALLLYGWFGLPEMGVTGVALSTLCCRMIGFCMLIVLLQVRLHIRIQIQRCFAFSRHILGQIMHIGLPAAGEQLSWMLQMMVLTSFVALLGDLMLAAQSYFFQISMFMMLFGLAIGLGTEILIGHMVGAGEMDKAYRQLLHSLKIGLVLTVISVLVLVALAHPLLSLFTDDPAIIRVVTHLFMLSLILETGRTFNIVVISSLRATGDARFPFYMGLLSMWGLSIPIAYWFGIHLGWGLLGIWCGFAVDEWVRGLAMFWRWKSRRWEKKVLVR